MGLSVSIGANFGTGGGASALVCELFSAESSSGPWCAAAFCDTYALAAMGRRDSRVTRIGVDAFPAVLQQNHEVRLRQCASAGSPCRVESLLAPSDSPSSGASAGWSACGAAARCWRPHSRSMSTLTGYVVAFPSRRAWSIHKYDCCNAWQRQLSVCLLCQLMVHGSCLRHLSLPLFAVQVLQNVTAGMSHSPLRISLILYLIDSTLAHPTTRASYASGSTGIAHAYRGAVLQCPPFCARGSDLIVPIPTEFTCC